MLTYEFIKTLWSLHTDPDLLPMDAQVLTPVHTKAKRFRLKKTMQPIFEAKLLSFGQWLLLYLSLIWCEHQTLGLDIYTFSKRCRVAFAEYVQGFTSRF